MSTNLTSIVQPGARVYFVGIGGIGMSALARYLKHAGCVVEGYDRTETPLTQALAFEGIAITYDIHTDWIADTNAVVWTPAVKDHPGVDLARQRRIPVLKRAELLGAIAATKKTLAVAGTHGKTTTTAITAHLLHHAGLGPTAFVGGIMANYHSNLLLGHGDWLVCEADEFDRSFLHLRPQHAVITSIDPDHLDIYGSTESMRSTYREFATQVRGQRFVSAEVSAWMSAHGLTGTNYGVGTGFDVSIRLLPSEGLRMRFQYRAAGVDMPELLLNMPGQHNVLNATAAISLALQAGVRVEQISAALAAFQGVERRFQIHIDQPGLVYVDDYAHHPSELSAAISAARAALPGYRVVAAFQPHLFSRTRDFLAGFGEALSLADEVILAPIYPARELPIPGVTSEAILPYIKSQRKDLVSLADVSAAMSARVSDQPTVFMTLGAGDIDTQVAAVKHSLLNQYLSPRHA